MATYHTTRAAVDDFVAQKTVALVGVSRSGKGFGHSLLKELLGKGSGVYARASRRDRDRRAAMRARTSPTCLSRSAASWSWCHPSRRGRRRPRRHRGGHSARLAAAGGRVGRGRPSGGAGRREGGGGPLPADVRRAGGLVGAPAAPLGAQDRQAAARLTSAGSGPVAPTGEREVDVAAIDIHADQPDPNPIADVHGALAMTRRPSTGGCRMRTHVPFGRGAGHERVEPLADPAFQQERRRRLAAPAAPPWWPRPPFVVQCAGEAGQVVLRVRRCRAGQRRLEQPLRDQVGITPIGRGRVGVVLHGQPEVPGPLFAGPLEGVLPGAEQLDDAQREIRETQRVGRRVARARKRWSARASGAGRQVSRRARAASSTIRSQRCGDRTTRRIDGQRALPRGTGP